MSSQIQTEPIIHITWLDLNHYEAAVLVKRTVFPFIYRTAILRKFEKVNGEWLVTSTEFFDVNAPIF